jgi:hypothetical protein
MSANTERASPAEIHEVGLRAGRELSTRRSMPASGQKSRRKTSARRLRALCGFVWRALKQD